jgi:hypothetical protein
LGSDPQYQSALAELAAQGVADDAGAKAQALRALSLFGEVPALEGVDMGVVGPNFATYAQEARPLAEKATREGLSIAARLEKQYKQNVRAIKNALAARGALQSGETGYQLGEEQQRYKEAGFDARTKLVDFLSGIEAGRAAAARSRAGGAQQALGSAMQNAMVMFPYGVGGPGAQGGGTPDPATGMGAPVQPGADAMRKDILDAARWPGDQPVYPSSGQRWTG